MKTIVILGVGTLGSISAQLWNSHTKEKLRIVLIDRDIVGKENLQRQTLYTSEDVGLPKVVAAKQNLDASEHIIEIVADEVNERTTDVLFGDVIIDGTDNLATRHLAAQYAWSQSIPFIYGGAVGTQGAVATFSQQTCSFENVFSGKGDSIDCATAGIDLHVASHVAFLQFTLGKQILFAQEYSKYLHILQGSNDGTINVVKILLPTTAQQSSKKYTDDVLYGNVTKVCGRNLFQAWIDKDVAQRIVGERLFSKIEGHTVFGNGRVLLYATSMQDAEKEKEKLTRAKTYLS